MNEWNHPYLTQEGYNLLQTQIGKCYIELSRIEQTTQTGFNLWRNMKRYIDGLEFLIDKGIGVDINE